MCVCTTCIGMQLLHSESEIRSVFVKRGFKRITRKEEKCNVQTHTHTHTLILLVVIERQIERERNRRKELHG